MKNGVNVNKLEELEKKLNKKLLKQSPNDRVTYAELLYELGFIDEIEMGNMIERELLEGGRRQWGGSRKEFHFDKIYFEYTVNEINILNKKGLYSGWHTKDKKPTIIDFTYNKNDNFWIDFKEE